METRVGATRVRVFIEFQPLETFFFFSSSILSLLPPPFSRPPLFFQEEQAASGRASAGMSGILCPANSFATAKQLSLPSSFSFLFIGRNDRFEKTSLFRRSFPQNLSSLVKKKEGEEKGGGGISTREEKEGI